jgi:hypothetical protein
MPRRRFQFRLRTLLIVVTLLAVVCGYVAHEAKIVRERDAMRLELKNLGWINASDHTSLPFIRRWLGDEQYSMILVPRGTSNDYIARVKAVFPESNVGPWPNIDFRGFPKSRPVQPSTQP